MLGFAVAILVFAGGFALGAHFTKNSVEAPAEEISEKELEKIRREREQIEADNRAFHTLMGYNQSMAYGVTAFEDGDGMK